MRLNSSTLTSSKAIWMGIFGEAGSARRVACVTAFLLVMIEAGFQLVPEGRFTRVALASRGVMIREPAPWLQIHGDSVAAGALNPRVLERALGWEEGKVRNDAIPGTTIFCFPFLLEQQIAAGRIPRLILLAYNPRSYTVPLVEKYLGRWGSWGDFWVAPRLGVGVEKILESLACRFSFALRYRLELNHFIRTRGENREYFREEPSIRSVDHEATWREEKPGDREKRKIVEFNAEFFGVPFRRSESADRALYRGLGLARAHGIRVLLVVPPEPRKAWEFRETNGFYHSFQEFLAEVGRDLGGEVLNEVGEWLPASDFLDGVHLDRRAGQRFSERVGDRLRESVGGRP